MRPELSDEMCYLAGVSYQGKEKSEVCLKTNNDAIAERFVSCAVKLGAKPDKIMIDKNDSIIDVHFYHSKIARQIALIRDKQTYIFRYFNSYSSNYFGGIFDSRGFSTEKGIEINKLSLKERIILESFGLRINGKHILSAAKFIAMFSTCSMRLSKRS